MKYEELFNLLKTLNIPVAYDHFNSNKTVSPPFIVYREQNPNTFKADDKTYYRPYNFEIELITDKKDITLESRVEELLKDIPYDIETGSWDEDEKIYHNFYYI